ncbi:hypothetical protein [Bradyrhizobium cosmicum]|uniref:DUF1127 domain-containing protein n=1 Tax=Bradyrhizobium cosmicum TaxID=1404864 RepID=UPI0028E4DBB8|nr:hypothetical protein [Bradyrhizobium cosmicum]
MSILFANTAVRWCVRRKAAAEDHQPSSWLKRLDSWLSYSERAHQRAALRDIADDPHLLADLGLTRDEALAQADKPFWK